MALFNLFFAFLRVGFFAIGGAYSFLPLFEKEVVEKYHWLTKEEFLDIAGVTQIFPGAISIKYATYTGYKIGGVWGAVLANLGNILPPALLIISASVFYARYKDSLPLKGAFNTMHLAVFAMILAVAFKVMDLGSIAQPRSIFIIVATFLIFMFTKVHPAIVIILAGLLGIIWK